MKNLADNLRPEVIKIVWADVKKVRVRRVVSRSNHKPTGKYPSWKMKRMMHWESKNECHAFILLDANPEVIEFHEQPCVIHYMLDGVKQRHYPDILVITKTSKELWEVKEKADSEKSEIAKRSDFLIQALQSYGYTYRVVLAESLAIEPQLTNAKRLLKLGRHPVSFLVKERFRLLFENVTSISWKSLCATNPSSRRELARLILEGYLSLDVNKVINEETAISITPKLGV